MRLIFLDTETTGLSPRAGDRIVEVAAIEMINRQATGNSIHFYINPQREVPSEASAIHGLTDQFLSDKPKFAEIAQELHDFIRDGQLVIHNAAFDISFLDHEFSLVKLAKLSEITSDSPIDTLQMARKKFGGRGHSLDSLCRRFKIDNSNRLLHGAMIDTELLMRIYIELTRGQASFNFAEEEIRADLPNNVINEEKNNLPVKVLLANAEELLAHQQYLEQVLKGKSLWNDKFHP